MQRTPPASIFAVHLSIELSRCDIAFYNTGGVYGHLLAYVKAHKDGIRL